jgi:flagellar biosynthesis protein FlhA
MTSTTEHVLSAERPAWWRLVGRWLNSKPAALVLTALLLVVLMLSPLPKLPLLLLAGICLVAAVWTNKQQPYLPSSAHGGSAATTPNRQAKLAATDNNTRSPRRVQPMQIELGFGLIHFVDADMQGDLVERIARLRTRIAEDLGLVVPPIWVTDNMDIPSLRYRILLRGAVAAEGQLQPDRLVVTGSETVQELLSGPRVTCAMTGLCGTWIQPEEGRRARAAGLTVRTAMEYLVAHLDETVRRHAPDMLNRQAVGDLLDRTAERVPSLSRDVRERFSTGQIQSLLHQLLEERVSIRNIQGILESMCRAHHAGVTNQTELLVAVRRSLGREICQPLLGPEGTLVCVQTSDDLEEFLLSRTPERQKRQAIRAGVTEAFASAGLRRPARVLLCNGPVRAALRDLLLQADPLLRIVSREELGAVHAECRATAEPNYSAIKELTAAGLSNRRQNQPGWKETTKDNRKSRENKDSEDG